MSSKFKESIMKKIKILIFIISLLMLTACSKNKNESYVSKSREVDSVFDKINVSNRSEREKLNKETEIDEDVETKTTLSNVNLRTKPIVDAELIIVINEGEKVIILEEDAGFGWTKIEYEG